MNKQELNRFIDKISPTGPGGIEKIKKVLKLVLDKESEGKEDEEGITEASYSDLKTLRDNGQLIPGHLYRITDYVTTTAQEGTTSAGHQFDIIVQAITENTLSEDAKAIQHEFEWPKQCWCDDITGIVELAGVVIINNKEYVVYKDTTDYCYAISKNSPEFAALDGVNGFNYCFTTNYVSEDMESWTVENSIWLRFKQDLRELSYFSNSNLAAWKLKYCIDNDTDRFAWARTEAQLSPTSHQKILLIYSNDNEAWIYVRYPEKDNENGCAWAYDGTSADIPIQEYITNGNEHLYTDDLVYTPSENVSIGDIVDLSGDQGTVIEVSQPEGNGVIYQMIDEYNNNCPYDFKNILFLRSRNWLVDKYTEWSQEIFSTMPNKDIYFYTFSWVNADFSIEDISTTSRKDDIEIQHNANNNTIGRYYIETLKRPLTLNDIIFVSSHYTDGGWFYGINYNTFANDCFNCTFGDNASGNNFDNNFFNNILLYGFCNNKSFGLVTGIDSVGNILNKIIYAADGAVEMKDINDAFVSNT